MNVILHTDPKFAAQLDRLSAASSLFDSTIEEQSRAIVEAVHERGDAALVEFVERFQGAKLEVDQLQVTQSELVAASLQADKELRAALADGSKNVSTFAKKSLRKNWSMRNSHGATVGEKFDPFSRVGIYIPGGMAPLVSTALMTIPLARVAGCREIVVCTPCNKDGQLNPALLFAARRPERRRFTASAARRPLPPWRWDAHHPAGAEDFRAGQRLRRRGQAAAVRPCRHGFAARAERTAGAGR